MKNDFYHELKYVDTLIYFDGPLLALFEREPGNFYLGLWGDETVNEGKRAEVWLYWKTSKTDIPGKEPDPEFVRANLAKADEVMVVTLVDDPNSSTSIVVAHEFISAQETVKRYMQEDPVTNSTHG